MGDADSASVQALIKYVYTGTLDPDTATMVMPLAHRYEMDNLVKVCVAHMLQGMTEDNVVEIVALLSKYSEHATVAAAWPQVLKKVSSDETLVDKALKKVR